MIRINNSTIYQLPANTFMMKFVRAKIESTSI